MLSKKMQAAINDQIQAELASAYLYLAMSAHFEAESLPGCAAWMRRQWREEIDHAMRLFDYVNDRSGRVELQAVPKPDSSFGSPLSIFERTLEHERKVTGLIHDLLGAAVKENDFATQVMLQWFVTEQVEEEKTAETMVEQLKRVGDGKSSIFFFDRHLAKETEKKDD
jgi:ferritin